MESNSESLIIIQMLKNIKEIINISKGRGCWNDEELKDIGITYHNVSEIVRQLQGEDKEVDESVEVQEMDEVD